jgi:hypothetical protein
VSDGGQDERTEVELESEDWGGGAGRRTSLITVGRGKRKRTYKLIREYRPDEEAMEAALRLVLGLPSPGKGGTASKPSETPSEQEDK